MTGPQPRPMQPAKLQNFYSLCTQKGLFRNGTEMQLARGEVCGAARGRPRRFCLFSFLFLFFSLSLLVLFVVRGIDRVWLSRRPATVGRGRWVRDSAAAEGRKEEFFCLFFPFLLIRRKHPHPLLLRGACACIGRLCLAICWLLHGGAALCCGSRPGRCRARCARGRARRSPRSRGI